MWASTTAPVAGLIPDPGRAFRPNACQQVQEAFQGRVAGQAAALEELLSSLCAHIAAEDRRRPLVVLLSGPPGVGKSFTARVVAQVLR